MGKNDLAYLATTLIKRKWTSAIPPPHLGGVRFGDPPPTPDPRSRIHCDGQLSIFSALPLRMREKILVSPLAYGTKYSFPPCLWKKIPSGLVPHIILVPPLRTPKRFCPSPLREKNWSPFRPPQKILPLTTNRWPPFPIKNESPLISYSQYLYLLF